MQRDTRNEWAWRAWQVLLEDARQFYCRRNLVRLAVGFAIGAALANSPLDAWLENAYRQHVHADGIAAQTCQLSTKKLGDRKIAILLPVAAMAVGALAPPTPTTVAVGSWGAQSARALVVGAPLAFGGVWLLGGDRPVAGSGSAWQPQRKTEHGISGHALAGAVPFLVLGGMTANPLARTAFYACSALTAWSRVDSRSHYPSQVFLGWWLALLAARTVQAARRTKPTASLPDMAVRR